MTREVLTCKALIVRAVTWSATTEPVLRAEVVKLLALKLFAVRTVVEREESVAL